VAVATVRAWHLAAVMVTPGGRGAAEALNGAWRPAAREMRQVD